MPPSDVPFDTSNPAVRDFLALTRLQVLTPLSVLINIAAVSICQFVVQPAISRVSNMYPTSITPSPFFIFIYALAIYVGLLGYCVLLVLARKTETKQALIRGSGWAIVLANWVMAFWAIAWIMQAFILSTVLAGILVVLLLYANIVLLVYHPPVRERPLDTALLHAPVRLFLILPLTITFWHSLFIAIGHHWDERSTKDYNLYKWEGFGVVLGVNLLGLLVVAFRRDIIWTVGASFLAAAVWSKGPKSTPVKVTALVFVFLHPVVLVASAFWVHFRVRKRSGPIALPPDEEGGPAEGNANGREEPRDHGAGRVWG